MHSPEQKIKHYCRYQERSHSEVKEKLYSLGLRKDMVEEFIAKLIEEDLLNEERFARQFARGKFSIKNWGRIKIRYELRQRKVSPYNINRGLEEIDETKYNATLKKLASQKWKLLKQGSLLSRQAKTTHYLLQKGFESSLIQQTIKEIASKQ